MSTPSESEHSTAQPKRLRSRSLGLTLSIEESAITGLLEAIQAVVGTTVEAKLKGVATEIEKLASAQPDQPKQSASASRGIEVSDALRKQATDLRMAVLMGKVPEDTGLLIDTKVAAKLLNISPRTLYRLQCEKAVPEPIRLAGNIIRWRLAELLAWVDADCPPQREWTYGTASKKNKRNL